MEKTNLWNDAAKYGAVMALAAILFNVAAMYVQSGWLALLSLSVFVTLLFLFTRRRASLYGGGPDGYGYGQCLKFIFCMMLFSGILEGAYQIAATHWLFAARYEAQMDTAFAAVAGMGVYTDDQLEMAVEMARRMMRSPIWLILSGVLGSVIKGVFFGLIVAAFAKRNPDVFAGGDDGEDRTNLA